MHYTNRKTLALGIAATLILSAPLYIHADENHHHEGEMSMQQHEHGKNMEDISEGAGMMGEKDSAFLINKQIDGYDVSFHVMEAQLGMMHSGNHNFMIKIEKDGKVVNDIMMNTKVIYPNGDSESKPAIKMGDWMVAGYDLHNSGRHQMMILFKTADGKKHEGGVYYPSN